MSINLNCIYHKDRAMLVVDDDKYQALLATGEWFSHPSLPSSQKEEKAAKPKSRSKKTAAEDNSDTSKAIKPATKE